MDVDSLKTAEYAKPISRIKSQDIPAAYEDNNISNKPFERKSKNDNTMSVSSLEEKKKESIEKAVEDSNKILQATSRRLSYKTHEKTNRLIVSVIDAETKEVIREIPPEKLLDAYGKMLELAGLIVDERS